MRSPKVSCGLFRSLSFQRGSRRASSATSLPRKIVTIVGSRYAPAFYARSKMAKVPFAHAATKKWMKKMSKETNVKW